MALSRGIRIAGSMDRLTAIHPLVFSSCYAGFIVRKPAGRSDRILRSRDCAALASFNTAAAVARCHFQ